MINDILVIDNVFDNVRDVVKFAKQSKYYDLKEHPIESNSNWVGYRSNKLEFIDENFSRSLTDQIVNKCIDYCFGNKSLFFTVRYSWACNLFFHQLTEKELYKNNWLHIDSTSNVYACICRRSLFVGKSKIKFWNNYKIS